MLTCSYAHNDSVVMLILRKVFRVKLNDNPFVCQNVTHIIPGAVLLASLKQ